MKTQTKHHKAATPSNKNISLNNNSKKNIYYY